MNSNLIFIFFSSLLVFCAVMVILSKHSVLSLLFLVGCFVFSSFLLLLLECEFLAFLFLIIYVGAIAVLFLFTIMMLEAKLANLSKNITKYVPVGFVFLILFLMPMLNLISNQFDMNILSHSFYFNKYQNWFDLIDSVTDVEVYGQALYSYFVLHFLISGFILLLVLVGVIHLTTQSNNGRVLEQSISKQLSRNFGFFFEKANGK